MKENSVYSCNSEYFDFMVLMASDILFHIWAAGALAAIKTHLVSSFSSDVATGCLSLNRKSRDWLQEVVWVSWASVRFTQTCCDWTHIKHSRFHQFMSELCSGSSEGQRSAVSVTWLQSLFSLICHRKHLRSCELMSGFYLHYSNLHVNRG